MRLRFLVLGLVFCILFTLLVLAPTTNNLLEETVNFDLSDGTLKEVNISYTPTVYHAKPFHLVLVEDFNSQLNTRASNYYLSNSQTSEVFSPEVIPFTNYIKYTWDNIFLTEDASFVLTHVDIETGEETPFYNFTAIIVRNSSFQLNKPELVIPGRDFQIIVIYESSNPESLILESEPAQSIETSVETISDIKQKYIFTTIIDEPTIFHLYEGNQIIDDLTFTVNLHPKNFCDPACDTTTQFCDNYECHFFLGNVGDYCDLTRPCLDGLECNNNICEEFTDVVLPSFGESCIDECEGNLECVNQICQYPTQTNTIISCITNDNCLENYICVNGFCQEETAISVNECVIDSDCDEGYFCNDTNECQEIISLLPLDSICFSNSDCEDGLICDGVCISSYIYNEGGDECYPNLNILCVENYTCNLNQNICVCNTSFCNQTQTTNPFPLVSEILPNNTNDEVLPSDNLSEEELLNIETLKKPIKDDLGVEKFKEKVLPENPQDLQLENKDFSKDFSKVDERVVNLVEPENEAKHDVEEILKQKRYKIDEIEQFEEKASENVQIRKSITTLEEKKSKEISTKVTLEVNPKNNQEDVYVIEVIPKEFIESAKDLIFNIKPIILEDDPIIMWHLENISENINLSYRVQKNVSLTGKTIFISEDIEPGFDWKTLLPLLFIPLFVGLTVIYSKFKEGKSD